MLPCQLRGDYSLLDYGVLYTHSRIDLRSLRTAVRTRELHYVAYVYAHEKIPSQRSGPRSD
jgi:hypothetical protein